MSTVTLTAAACRYTRTHPQASTTSGASDSPNAAIWAEPHFGRSADEVYATSGATTPMSAAALVIAGGGQPHNNLPPYLAVNFIIALVGSSRPAADRPCGGSVRRYLEEDLWPLGCQPSDH